MISMKRTSNILNIDVGMIARVTNGIEKADNYRIELISWLHLVRNFHWRDN